MNRSPVQARNRRRQRNSPNFWTVPAPERLDPWLQRAQDGAIPALRRFAKRLSADYDAVRAAVTLAWSNGPVEGQVNRLKAIKRTMYGRANLDLLERRFLMAA